MRIFDRLPWIAGGLLLVGAIPASGFVPPERSALEEALLEPASAGEPSLGRFVRAEEFIDSDLEAFRQRVGGEWAIQRNPLTGTPHHVLGSGFDYATESVTGAARAEELARAFLADFAPFFQADPERLGEPWIEHHGGKWGVVFPEIYGDLPVYGGRAHVVLTDTGRICAAGSDFHPSLELGLAGLMDEAEAVAIAKADLGYVEDEDFMREEPELFIYPERTGDAFTYRPAWKVVLHMQSPFGGWESWIDAFTGEIFARRDVYEYVDVAGDVRGEVENSEYCAGSSELHFKDMNVSIDGGATAQSGDDGTFVISNGGTDSVLVTTRFRGPYFREYRVDGAVARDSVKVLPGEPAGLRFDDANSHVAERDAWFHHWIVRDFIKGVDPDLTAADYQMPVRLNRTDGYCPGNAWWDGTGTNFCKQSSNYSNTARLGDVIYHEYCHGVSGWIYGGSPFSGALSEGNSDVMSMLILKRPTLGVGFGRDLCNSGIRSANKGFLYPDDLSGEGHNDGQAISSFFWEVRNRMVTSYGEAYADSVVPRIWHFSRKAGKPSNLPDQVTWAFIYDDTDGNLDNGTPNFSELAGAATEIGFAVPTITEGIEIAHGGLPSTIDTVSARTVTAVVTGLSAPVDPSSVVLHYRVNNGSYTDVPMSPTGGADEYEADIPALPRASRVAYYVEAADTASHVSFSPTNAPARTHWYEVVDLYDPCESVGGWTLGDAADDATKGIWINTDPVGNLTRPEDDVTPGGTNCFVTGNTGNVRNGKTTLYSPFYPIGGTDHAVVRYSRWYSNNFAADGALATLDEWWNADVSADGGASWTPMENVGTGSESWVDVAVDLGDLFGPVDSVQFRFVARDTGSATRVHAAVDEFRVVFPVATSVDAVAEGGEAPLPAVARLRGNRPNPFNPRTVISFDLPARGRASLDIFSVTGRRVRTLVDGTGDAGRHEVAWDGTDESGVPVASGVYFYRLESEGVKQSRKMLLVR